MKARSSFFTGTRQKNLVLVTAALALVAFGVLSLFPLKSWVDAQNAAQGLEVSPPSQEVTVDPGKTVTVTTTIRNRSTGPLPVNVRIEDFTAEGEDGQVAITSGSPWSITSWTVVSPQEFTLGGGEEQEVTATIRVPGDAAGGRYGSFVFAVEGDTADGSGAALTQQIASLFLVRISGPVNEVLRLTEMNTPAYSEFGPVPISMKFTNTGNVHTKTYGIINVTNMFGQKVADIVVPGTNIFPQAERVVTSELNKRFLFGPHTATAIMYYGATENQTLNATTTFWVFPTRIAVAILGILLILWLFRKRIGKALRIVLKG